MSVCSLTPTVLDQFECNFLDLCKKKISESGDYGGKKRNLNSPYQKANKKTWFSG